jgi:hypothetical protein
MRTYYLIVVTFLFGISWSMVSSGQEVADSADKAIPEAMEIANKCAADLAAKGLFTESAINESAKKCYNDNKSQFAVNLKFLLAKAVVTSYQMELDKHPIEVIRSSQPYEGAAVEQKQRDNIKNRATSPAETNLGDGLADKTEGTSDYKIAINTTSNQQVYTIAGNLYRLVYLTDRNFDINNSNQYQTLSNSLIYNFLLNSQISLTVPQSMENNGQLLSFQGKFFILGDRDPRNSRHDKTINNNLESIHIAEMEPDVHPGSTDGKINSEIQSSLKEDIKWLEAVDKTTKEIEKKAEVRLLVSRTPLAALMEGDTTAFDSEEGIWKFVIAVDKMVVADNTAHVEINLTGNLKYQISEYSGRASHDDLNQNDQRLQGDLSGTCSINKSFLLSVEGEGDWDLESRDKKYKLSEVVTVPVSDKYNFLVTFRQQEKTEGKVIFGLNAVTDKAK